MPDEAFDPAPYMHAGRRWVEMAGATKLPEERAFFVGVCQALQVSAPIVVYRQPRWRVFTDWSLVVVLTVLLVLNVWSWTHR